MFFSYKRKHRELEQMEWKVIHQALLSDKQYCL